MAERTSGGRVLLLERSAAFSTLIVARLVRAGVSVEVWDRADAFPSPDDCDGFDLVLLGRNGPRCPGDRFLDQRPPEAALVIPALRPSLSIGMTANDPFSGRFLSPALEDCAVRVCEHLSREHMPDGMVLRWGDLLFQLRPKFVEAGGCSITLTQYETDTLSMLIGRGGEILSTATLRRVIFGHKASRETNVVEVHISRLRSKLAKSGTSIRIETVRYQGYVLFWRESGAPVTLPMPAIAASPTLRGGGRGSTFTRYAETSGGKQ